MKRTFTRNDMVLGGCLAFVALMLGAAYAAVPLYYLFCQATGYNGTPIRATHAASEIDDRIVTVRFDTNVDPTLFWTFQPLQRSVKVRVTATPSGEEPNSVPSAVFGAALPWKMTLPLPSTTKSGIGP